MPDVSPIVYLVDDDASVRKSIARLLESSGFEVEAFSEPEAFLEHLTAHSVPVAVLDIWMKGMSGMVLLAHLCEDHPARGLSLLQPMKIVPPRPPSCRPAHSLSSPNLLTTRDFWLAVRDAFGHTLSR